MQDRPTQRELVQAARELFELEVLPTITDPRLKFRTLVALNALGMAEREMFAGDVFVDEELSGLRALLGAAKGPLPESRSAKEDEAWALRRSLAARIREGAAPEGTGAFLKTSIGHKLAVASPRFAARYG
ncbi:MAG: DUF6285 domain-containing protein [Polyangiaceae bacterium]